MTLCIRTTFWCFNRVQIRHFWQLAYPEHNQLQWQMNCKWLKLYTGNTHQLWKCIGLIDLIDSSRSVQAPPLCSWVFAGVFVSSLIWAPSCVIFSSSPNDETHPEHLWENVSHYFLTRLSPLLPAFVISGNYIYMFTFKLPNYFRLPQLDSQVNREFLKTIKAIETNLHINLLRGQLQKQWYTSLNKWMQPALRCHWPMAMFPCCAATQHRCTLGIKQLLLSLSTSVLELDHLPLWDFL